jgi:hypothetical protein
MKGKVYTWLIRALATDLKKNDPLINGQIPNDYCQGWGQFHFNSSQLRKYTDIQIQIIFNAF